jgi:ABC-type branched-subunit amino acid transport system substrate-binding protein
VTSAKQQGLKLKAAVLFTGYGQALLDQPTALATANNDPSVIFGATTVPDNKPTPAYKVYKANLKKYAGFPGVPGFEQYEGYVTADLLIKGLEGAGKNPTRTSFLAALHSINAYDQAGLGCQTYDLTLKTFGQYAKTSCGWYATVKNGKFVSVTNKPIRGKLLAVAGG